MSYQIHELSAADEPTVARVQYLLNQLSPRANKGITRATLQLSIDDDRTVVLVAESGGTLYGILTMSYMVKPNGTAAWVEALVIDAEYRGRGLGRKLMEQAVKQARDRGCHRIFLTSLPQRDAANHLYPSLGFQIIKTNFYDLPLN